MCNLNEALKGGQYVICTRVGESPVHKGDGRSGVLTHHSRGAKSERRSNVDPGDDSHMGRCIAGGMLDSDLS